MRTIVLVGFLAISGTGRSQVSEAEKTVTAFFQAFNNADSVAVSSLILPEAQITTVQITNSDTVLLSSPFSAMFEFFRSQKDTYTERIGTLSSLGDEMVSTVSCEYSFEYRGEISHCGTNIFLLMKKGEQWKIASITDSRLPCDVPISDPEKEVDVLMSNWHKAAGNADFDGYFDPLAEHFVYLGTDSSERWIKEEFALFCQPYFDQGKGWSFSAIHRFVQLSGNIAYVDEVLDTWMGPCRGSAVLKCNDSGEWKLLQYNLAVLVPNDKMDVFRKKVWGLDPRN